MSISNSTLVRDALGLIGVLGVVESAQPEQAEHGIRVMNRLMLSLQADGIDLQYFEQTDPASDCPIPPDAQEFSVHALSWALAPYYGKPTTIEMRAEIERLASTLRRITVSDQMKPAKSILPWGEGDLRLFGTVNLF